MNVRFDHMTSGMPHVAELLRIAGRGKEINARLMKIAAQDYSLHLFKRQRKTQRPSRATPPGSPGPKIGAASGLFRASEQPQPSMHRAPADQPRLNRRHTNHDWRSGPDRIGSNHAIAEPPGR